MLIKIVSIGINIKLFIDITVYKNIYDLKIIFLQQIYRLMTKTNRKKPTPINKKQQNRIHYMKQFIPKIGLLTMNPKIFSWIITLFLCYPYTLQAQIPSKSYNTELESKLPAKDETDEWKAGILADKEKINRCGWKSFFKIKEIGPKLFKRIYKKSYKEDCTIPLEDLRYLTILHYNLNQEICQGELICNKKISSDLIKIFQTLFEAQYPIERMVLIDEYNADDEASMRANNTTCFNFRKVAGTKVLSNHSKGLAIDINPLYNPFVKQRNGKTFYQPSTGKKYINRSADFPYKISHKDLCYQMFKHYGFIWGGDWTSLKDYQHFEKDMK